MKKYIYFFCFLFFGSCVLAAKIIPIPGIIQPHSIDVDNNQLYICERSTVFIYSLKDFGLIKKIGREGEGPEEFKGAVFVNSQTERLIVSGFGKMAFFNKKGDYLNELRIPNLVWRHITPIDNHYVVFEDNYMGKRKIIICNAKLEKVNTIVTAKRAHRRGEVYKSSFFFKVNGKKIFVVMGGEFIIDIFSKDGKKLSSIVRKYERIKFTKKMQEELLESYRRSPITKDFYNSFKEIVIFPEYYPAINDLFVSDNKIFVQTFKTTDKKTEFLIFKENGKFLKSTFLPVKDKEFMLPAIFTINNGKLYNLCENEDQEEWELHIVDIQ